MIKDACPYETTHFDEEIFLADLLILKNLLPNAR